jgi:hypothetical protein
VRQLPIVRKVPALRLSQPKNIVINTSPRKGPKKVHTQLSVPRSLRAVVPCGELSKVAATPIAPG